MNRLLLSIVILLAGVSLITPHLVGAYELCRSERKGYCVRLNAHDLKSAEQRTRELAYTQAIAFPGLEFLSGPPFDITYEKSEIGDILIALYRFGVGIAGLSAFGMFVFGGIYYLTAGGSDTRTNRGRQYMLNALYGLLLVLLSYLILYIINPDFTFTLKLQELKY